MTFEEFQEAVENYVDVDLTRQDFMGFRGNPVTITLFASILDELKAARTSLENADDLIMVYRLQGMIRAFAKVLDLPSQIADINNLKETEDA